MLKVGDHIAVQHDDGQHVTVYRIEHSTNGMLFRFVFVTCRLKSDPKLEELLVVLKDVKEQQ